MLYPGYYIYKSIDTSLIRNGPVPKTFPPNTFPFGFAVVGLNPLAISFYSYIFYGLILLP